MIYIELKQINQGLALDILKFSVLQSGFSYNPSAFLQALPADEVLAFTSEYFSDELIESLNMENIYRLFIQNNAENSRIVNTTYVNNDEQKLQFREGEVLSHHPLPFIAKKVLVSKAQEGISTKSVYLTKLFEFDRATDKGNIFKEVAKRGLPFKLINTGGPILSVEKGTDLATISFEKNATFAPKTNTKEASATEFENQDEFQESRNLLDITSSQALEDEQRSIEEEGECP